MNRAYEPQWYDLAERFDIEDEDIRTPPFDSWATAAGFRAKFYSWRASIKRDEIPGQPLFQKLHSVVAMLESSPDGWCVRFALTDKTPTASVLDQMTRRPADEEGA